MESAANVLLTASFVQKLELTSVMMGVAALAM
jgi:hypothetical protein